MPEQVVRIVVVRIGLDCFLERDERPLLVGVQYGQALLVIPFRLLFPLLDRLHADTAGEENAGHDGHHYARPPTPRSETTALSPCLFLLRRALRPRAA